MAKITVFELKWLNLISRKIWVTLKFLVTCSQIAYFRHTDPTKLAIYGFISTKVAISSFSKLETLKTDALLYTKRHCEMRGLISFTRGDDICGFNSKRTSCMWKLTAMNISFLLQTSQPPKKFFFMIL